MPKYEYACKSCGEHLEVLQTFADEPLSECPACSGVLRKVFSAPSIAFKGSGFYRTDNRKRRSESTSEAKSDSKTDAKGDGKGDSKGESKTDSKTEPAKRETASSSDAKPKAAEAKTA